MQNYIQILDESGNVYNNHIIENLLTNIQRFDLELSKIKPTIQALVENWEIDRLKMLANDFYNTWYASSTELINTIELPKCMEYLIAFREYFYITWPHDALEFIENNGMNATIQIYRGASESEVAYKNYGLSWTTSLTVAEYYATRAQDGVVLNAEVKMSDVLIYLEEESEIIVMSSNVKFSTLIL
jgi:hypothetical protein